MLGARVSGHIAAILPRDNAQVRAGEVVFRIDDGDYRIAVNAARTKIETQQATIERIGRQITAQESAVEQAKAQLASAEAGLKRADLDFDRQQNLSAKGFASRATFEVSEASRDQGMIGVALNLALLGYFKYTNFIVESVNMVTGAPLPFAGIVLPLGISFFTFQQIAYLVDVMRGAKVERDIASYTLFVSFFPHLIAGPLVHHAEMIPQFKRGRTGRSAVLAARGLAIFAAGLFKKVVIADNLAQFVSPVFAHDGGILRAWIDIAGKGVRSA